MPKKLDPAALQERLATALAREDWTSAESLLTDLTVAAPNNAPVYYNRGLVRRRQGNGEDALADFEKALELDPYYDKALFEYGALELENGNWARAASGFESYLELVPGDLDARLNLVNALLRADRPEDARAQARTAVQMKESAGLLLALAEAERDCGNLDAMEAALKKIAQTKGAKKDPALAARILSIRSQGNRGRFSLRP
ncbi:MAG: tetratricopeptide repeat protein [Alphaproteobacteria bacterium]|nr:tetratricopeptide repeat protein [Alphaproteobacteria bacterium]